VALFLLPTTFAPPLTELLLTSVRRSSVRGDAKVVRREN